MALISCASTLYLAVAMFLLALTKPSLNKEIRINIYYLVVIYGVGLSR